MPALLSDIQARVESLLRRRDAKVDSCLSVIEIQEQIAHEYIALRSELPAARVYATSYLTLTNADGTFTLPTTSAAQYAGEIRIQLQSDARFLKKERVETLDSYRQGQVVVAQGRPMHFCLWREKDQTVKGRVWPAPSQPEPCNVFYSLDAEDLRVTDYGTVTVNLSRIGETALALRTAATLAASLPAEELKARKLNPAVAGQWLKTASRLAYKAACETWDLETTDELERWVP